MKDSANAERILEALRTSPPSGEIQPSIQINFNGPIIVTPDLAAAIVRIILRRDRDSKSPA